MSPQTLRSNPRPRVLSGMRPTGRLHLGNLMGALNNWVQLQNDYDCFFFIADLHALTTDYADPSQLKQNIFEIALDFFAAGLNPGKCSVFIQSHVPQHAELHLLFSMFTPLGWLERVPTYKDQQAQLTEKELSTYGFLGYPLLQSADILLYRPQFVPVGADQVSHVELTREVARRFNQLYSPKRLVSAEGTATDTRTEPDPDRLLLPEPQVLLTHSPKLPGLDGRKMSKSYGNAIYLSDTREDILAKMHTMTNGGQRPTQHDPGDPDICPVGDLHRIFSVEDVKTLIHEGCRNASIGCEQCKGLAGLSIDRVIAPMRQHREDLASRPQNVWDALEAGRSNATKAAESVMAELREATGLSRNLSGIRLHRSQTDSTRADQRNLAAHLDWLNLEAPLIARNLRELWRRDVVPSETQLKAEGEGTWTTVNGRRMFAAVGLKNPDQLGWQLTAKPKSYELLALLCWGEDNRLLDFIVPQKLYLAPWIAAKKAAGKEDIRFALEQQGDRFLLHLPSAEPIDITETKGSYGAL